MNEKIEVSKNESPIPYLASLICGLAYLQITLHRAAVLPIEEMMGEDLQDFLPEAKPYYFVMNKPYPHKRLVMFLEVPSGFSAPTENEETILLRIDAPPELAKTLVEQGNHRETSPLILGDRAVTWQELGDLAPWIEYVTERQAELTRILEESQGVDFYATSKRLDALSKLVLKAEETQTRPELVKMTGQFAEIFEDLFNSHGKSLDSKAMSRLLALASELVGKS